MIDCIGPEGTSANHFVVGEIVEGFTHGQVFRPSKNRLAGIRLFMATFGRPASGRLRFTFQDYPPKPGLEPFVEQIECATIRDNEWLSIRFPALHDSRGRTFRFVLENPAGIPGTAPTVWASHEDPGEGSFRTMDGLPVPGSLCFQPVYD